MRLNQIRIISKNLSDLCSPTNLITTLSSRIWVVLFFFFAFNSWLKGLYVICIVFLNSKYVYSAMDIFVELICHQFLQKIQKFLPLDSFPNSNMIPRSFRFFFNSQLRVIIELFKLHVLCAKTFRNKYSQIMWYYIYKKKIKFN